MKHVTKGLEPERLWYHFEEISRIPRASGNEEKAAEYIVRIARRRGLRHTIDAAGNVLVVRNADEGYESVPAVVLQSHLDMVAEKNESSRHDFSKHPIELVKDGEWVRAKDTTLGADNGIGVAAMIAALEDESVSTGKIECLFTVEEETGLVGAAALKPDLLSGRLFLNLDAEEIKAVYIGCAGGKDSLLTLFPDTERTSHTDTGLRVEVRGLSGGHSGVDIHLPRGNAIKILARVLAVLEREVSCRISSLEGGGRLNAIPREAFCTLAVPKERAGRAKEVLGTVCDTLRREYSAVSATISFGIGECPCPDTVCDPASTKKIVDLLMAIPHGVISMSPRMEGLVETSTNLASVRLENERLFLSTSQRSSVKSALEWVCDEHRAIARLSGASIEQTNGYPGWEPDPDSRLLAKVKKAVRRVTKQEAAVKAVHAGLECSVIKDTYPKMDMVSIGPTVTGVHSPSERVNIKSVRMFWEILIASLAEIRGS
ncbi:MAG: aminoacyl-histidine dipeptidase [Spirochaetes bacterium]|nr:aminoacyl-histidine dipeptidase [Spirochaetota bacterium]